MNSLSPAIDDMKLCHHVQSIDEKDLIRAAKCGHEWAFLELNRRNSARVFKTIYGVTKNREDAEDAMQNSLMRAFVHLKNFDERSRFSTWLTRIGINSAIMLLRKKRVYRETSMADPIEGSDAWNCLELADHSPDPEQSYVARERTTRLRKAIRRLPAQLRTVVEILEADRCSMQELSEIAGLTVPAVKSRLARARATLRKSLDEPARGVRFSRNRSKSSLGQIDG